MSSPILLRDNRDAKDVFRVVEGYLRHNGITATLVRDHAPYRLLNDESDLILSMDGFERRFPIIALRDLATTHGILYFAASVDADASAFDVLDELQCLWRADDRLVDEDGPLEICDRTLIIATAQIIPNTDVMIFDADAEFVTNQARAVGDAIPVHGYWRDAFLSMQFDGHDAIIGKDAVFHQGRELTLQVVDPRFPAEPFMRKLRITTNLRYAVDLDGGVLRLDPSTVNGKGFLQLSIDMGPYFKAEPFDYRFIFYKV